MFRCEFCGKEHDGTYATGRFCSESCSRRFSLSKQDQKAKKTILCSLCQREFEVNIHSDPKICKCQKCKELKRFHNYYHNKQILIHPYKCKWCGQTPCQRKDICKHHQLFPSLISYFGMNQSTIGTIDVYKEFERIQAIIREEYIEDKLSLTDLRKKYKHDDIRNFGKIINSLGIERRSQSESVSLAVIQGKLVLPINCFSTYKHGWHTTWNLKQVYFRSSYEEDYYKILDSQKIDYEVESLRIQYWDSVQLRFRTAIPDIYIPSTNTIIEIKGQYTFDTDKQQMIDKFEAYKEHGYNTKLILEKKEIDF